MIKIKFLLKTNFVPIGEILQFDSYSMSCYNLVIESFKIQNSGKLSESCNGLVNLKKTHGARRRFFFIIKNIAEKVISKSSEKQDDFQRRNEFTVQNQ